MSCPPSAAVRTSNVLSDAVAQHGHRYARRLRREFHRAETADRAAVDGQQQVALAQQLRGRRAGNDAGHAQHLAMHVASGLEPLHPRLGQAELARLRDRHGLELDLERIERPRVLDRRDRLDDQFHRQATVDLRYLAPGLDGEARPQRAYATVAADDHAVEVRRPVHEPRHLEVRLPELQRARQREADVVHRGDGGGNRTHARIAVHADDDDGLSRHEFAGIERRGTDRRPVEQLRIERDDRDVVQRVHVLDSARHLDRPGERQAHVAHGDRHGVAIHGHESASGVHHEAGPVVVPLGDAGHRERHRVIHEHE